MIVVAELRIMKQAALISAKLYLVIGETCVSTFL